MAGYLDQKITSERQKCPHTQETQSITTLLTIEALSGFAENFQQVPIRAVFALGERVTLEI